MNYLGHLFLAEPDPDTRLGNLIGDWIKGDIADHRLPPRIAAGVRQHRAVDAASDHHPAIQRARARFTGRHRRVAGIALDVLWDHFLIVHWPAHHEGTLDEFLDACYSDLRRALPRCPAPAGPRVQRIIDEDWIRSYHSLDNVTFALARIGQRLSRDPGLHDIHGPIRQLYSQLESDFLSFPLVDGRAAAVKALTGDGGTLTP